MMTKLAGLMRMSSLRQALILTGIFIFVLILGGLITQLVNRKAIEREVEQGLIELANELKEEVINHGRVSILADFLYTDPFTGELFGYKLNNSQTVVGEFKASVFDSLGMQNQETLALFNDLGESNLFNLNANSMLMEDEELAEEEFIWKVLVIEVLDARLAVAIPLDEIDLIESTLPLSLLITGSMMSLVTLFGGLILGLKSQQRVTAIKNKLNQISEGDLSIRLLSREPKDDLDQVMQSVDKSTEKIAHLVNETKNLSVNIAHELRMPLTRLRASLERELNRGDFGISAFETALNEVAQLESIFDTIMNIAGFNAGKNQDRLVNIDLAELANDVYETYHVVVEDNVHQLQLEIDNPAIISGDISALKQALSNLIKNSMVHANQQVTITLFVTENVIGVADTGIGIPPGERDNVLNPMYQIKKSRSNNGVGLGLALVKAVADLHNAEISLHATDNLTQTGLTVKLIFSD